MPGRYPASAAACRTRCRAAAAASMWSSSASGCSSVIVGMLRCWLCPLSIFKVVGFKKFQRRQILMMLTRGRDAVTHVHRDMSTFEFCWNISRHRSGDDELFRIASHVSQSTAACCIELGEDIIQDQ